MKKMLAVVAMAVALTLPGIVSAAEKAPQKVVDLTSGELANIGEAPVIVSAVKAQNAKGMSLDSIKELDGKWKGTAGIADYMQALMDSECGKHLSSLQSSKPYLAEVFVMDNQGANVCMSDKTSDYWQGDEAKFKESFKGGAGAVHISDVKFDDSTQTYLVQSSIPVKDGGKVIGAITFGVDVDQVE